MADITEHLIEIQKMLAERGYHVAAKNVFEAVTEIEMLRSVAEPFAACVFNDNGDVTISQGGLTEHDWLAARNVIKRTS